MADDEKPRKGRAADTAQPRMKTSSERPFDLWLHKQLHAMYDEIASEPLPADLLKLIDRDAAKSGKGNDKKSDTSADSPETGNKK
jgi:hypothetical protein